MSLFRDLGRRVERFRQEAEDAAGEPAYECADCGAGFHGDREECPECGGRVDPLD